MTFPADIREKLFTACHSLIRGKIDHAREYLDSVSESVQDETKSTAGDKHETGRAMAQIEQEKAARQLNDLIRQEQELLKIRGFAGKNFADRGSIVITDKQNFYVSIALGAFTLDKFQFYAISPASPIGAMIIGKKQQDSFILNGNEFCIERIL